jgi:beta-lactamase superfamily II metal-dependent hydrolase
MHIHVLPASFGDAILIEYGKPKKYILIDGGPYFNFDALQKGLKQVAPAIKKLELLVITHVDIDHIDGIIMLLNMNPMPFTIKDVWFNGYDQLQAAKDDLMGTIQGDYLSALISSKQIKQNRQFKGKAVMVTSNKPLPVITLTGGMKLTILGPNDKGLSNMRKKWEAEQEGIRSEANFLARLQNDKRYTTPADDLLGGTTIEAWQKTIVKGDVSEANGCSIAFMSSYQGKRCLFTGDLFTDYMLPSIEQLCQEDGTDRLHVDAWKLAHHGSKKSTLESLMKKITARHILISSDGKRYAHPDPETIAKLLLHKSTEMTLHFNYRTPQNKIWENSKWKKKWLYDTRYPEHDDIPGISLML